MQIWNQLVLAGLGFSLTFPISNIKAEEIFRIEVGRDYQNYSNSELRQRIWQLEKAVHQLQMRVFKLEAQPNVPATPAKQWTCRLQSFGKTFIGSGNTRASSLAQALKACGDATHAIHCHESDAKCDSE